MRTDKQFFKSIALAALLGTGFAGTGIAQDSTNIVDPETKAPVILSTTPADGEMNVDLSSSIKITFDSEMDETTIDENSLLFHATSDDFMYNKRGEMMDDQMQNKSAINDPENHWQNASDAVDGTISYSNKVAEFTPDTDLKENTKYTFTVTHRVKNMESVALENDYTWSFRTAGSSDSTYAEKQNDSYGTYGNKSYETSTDTSWTAKNGESNIIDLGKAGQYVILTKEFVVINSASRITGQIGEGSVADSFNNAEVDSNKTDLKTNGRNVELQSNQSDTTSPDVNEAIEDMMTAFSNASMQNKNDSVSTAHMNASFKDSALTSGTYEWSDSLTIDSDLTLAGSADDMWVFKVGDNLTVQENTTFTLTDGARAENIFWVVEGGVTIGENASFEGIILSMNEITLEKGAALNGRMYSQTSINLDDNVVSEPGNFTGQRTSTNR